MSNEPKWTNGPWEIDTIDHDGEYGDGGPDSRSGYKAYAVYDAEGRVLFDSLNRDVRASEIHEEFPSADDHGHYAWDECARRDLTLAAAAPTMHAEMSRYLEILERAEADPENWSKLTAGTGIATANGYRAALAKAVQS